MPKVHHFDRSEQIVTAKITPLTSAICSWENLKHMDILSCNMPIHIAIDSFNDEKACHWRMQKAKIDFIPSKNCLDLDAAMRNCTSWP